MSATVSSFASASRAAGAAPVSEPFWFVFSFVDGRVKAV
jgi:hypothetical protein